MGHRLVLQQGSVIIRLDGTTNPHILAAELRELLDKQPTPLAILIDFTHASDIDQSLKSQIYRMFQHPKAARTVGFFGLTPHLLQELQGLLTGLAQSRKIVVRDTNADFDQGLTLGDRMADRVAAFGGSWTFIGLFLAFLLAWALILVCYFLLPGPRPDPGNAAVNINYVHGFSDTAPQTSVVGNCVARCTAWAKSASPSSTAGVSTGWSCGSVMSQKT